MTPPTPTAEQPVIASRTITDNGHALRADLSALQVRGATITLDFTLTEVSTPAQVKAQRGGRWVAQRNFADWRAGRSPSYSIDGIYLIDSANAKRHLVARGADQQCVCTFTAGMYLGQGDSARLAATFGAPPPEVSALDVVIPLFGEFPNVPVQR